MNTTLIIPTYNEAENIPELMRRIRSCMDGANILVVDDSPGYETARAAYENGCQVHRTGEKRGLAKAVIDGIDYVRWESDTIIIMDADLQHPPEVLPAMVEALDSNDFAIASRYVERGGISSWSWKRKLISRGANLLAAPLTLFKVKDSMSGFAGFKTKGLPEMTSLNVGGYKIITELMVRGNWNSIAEVPYSFGNRERGESKLGSSHFKAYLKQLISLYLHKFRWIKFSLVGFSGTLVSLGILYLLTEIAGFPYIGAAIVSSLLAITNNYAWNRVWTFEDRTVGVVKGWLSYLALAGTTSLLYLGILALLTEVAGFWYMLSAVVAILMTFLIRYFAANRYIWRQA